MSSTSGGVGHRVRVCAVNALGASPWSESLLIRKKGLPSTTAVLIPPSVLFWPLGCPSVGRACPVRYQDSSVNNATQASAPRTRFRPSLPSLLPPTRVKVPPARRPPCVSPSRRPPRCACSGSLPLSTVASSSLTRRSSPSCHRPRRSPASSLVRKGPPTTPVASVQVPSFPRHHRHPQCRQRRLHHHLQTQRQPVLVRRGHPEARARVVPAVRVRATLTQQALAMATGWWRRRMQARIKPESAQRRRRKPSHQRAMKAARRQGRRRWSRRLWRGPARLRSSSGSTRKSRACRRSEGWRMRIRAGGPLTCWVRLAPFMQMLRPCDLRVFVGREALLGDEVSKSCILFTSHHRPGWANQL